jgi:hypothetical protein
MSVLLETHLVVAFLLAFCAIIFSWNPAGRRVVNAVAGLQILIGIALAATMGMSRIPLPPSVWIHLLIALLIMASYGFAMRAGKRAGGANKGLLFAIAGLVLIVVNIAYGWKLAGH